jgi:AcrR family transcriptional regulator
MNTVSSEKRKYELKARAAAQEETRRRIAAAASQLHEEKGVAATTVADIARRAGVQRLTVYNHFPGLAELIPACNGHFEAEHPFPDLSAAMAQSEPRERVRAVLAAVYAWYRETRTLQRNINSDRATVPEVEEFMAANADAQLDGLAAELARGFGRRGRPGERVRVLIRLALEFWTWQRLDAEGLEDEAAAELMAATLCAADA